MTSTLSRRSFLAGTAAFAASVAALGLPRRAFADDAQAAEGAVVILHTNDAHCAVGETDAAGAIPLGYSALASYVANRRSVFGNENVTLVDAGDAVQGKVMGTITQGQALVDIMNECGYDIVIPGNHEFDYGMTQFNHLIGSANAKYLSCNFTDNRTGTPTLMFDPYTIKEYPLPTGGTVRVAFVGVTTPATLTASSPRSFWRSDDDHTCVYGFCEDETGSKLAQAVQGAVDEARAAGAEFVVLLAHLGQTGQPSQWRSDTLVSRCEGINVVIDGHSHEEYAQIVQDRNGDDVVIAQTGTQFSSVGQIVIIPDTGTIHASTYSYEASLLRETRKPDDPSYVKEVAFGRDAQTQAVVDEKAAEVEAQTGTVVGRSEVDLFAYEADSYTWAVRAHETNLGDFVADAYLYYASNNGVMPDVAFVNGGGVRTNLLAGNVTRADLINVNPFNNQLCYTQVTGQDLLDALELSARAYPEPLGDFLQVSEGLTFTIRTDIDSPVILSGNEFAGFKDGAERRVRRVTLHGKAIDPAATYTLVCHSYYLVDGGGSYSMLTKNTVTLLGLDNDALMEYVQLNLHGVIGQEYDGAAGLGRMATQVGPDKEEHEEKQGGNPNPAPIPEDNTPAPESNPKPLAATGDAAATAAAAAAAFGAAVAAGAAPVAAEAERQ